jgi:hypothetical protein
MGAWFHIGCLHIYELICCASSVSNVHRGFDGIGKDRRREEIGVARVRERGLNGAPILIPILESWNLF